MTLKTRRFLFYLLTFLFVVAALGVILYSSGYRIDFRSGKITETGAIYLRSNPADVGITLNGKPIKVASGIFRSGTLVDNLLPGDYVITVSKEGFYNWHKNVDVDTGAVSTFDSIILVPENGLEKIGEPVEDFYLQNGRFLFKKGGKLLFENTQVVGDTVAKFTSNGSIVSYDSSSGSYHLSNIFDLSKSLNLSVIFNNLKESRLNLPGAVPIVKIEPYPSSDRRFVVMTGRALYTLDTDNLDIKQVAPQADDFAISGNNLFWVNSEGVYTLNLLFNNPSTVVSLADLNASSITDIKADSSGKSLALLTSDKRLIVYNLDSKEAEVISKSAGEFSFSPEGKILAFAEDGSAIRVYRTDPKAIKTRLFTLFTLPGTTVDSISWYSDNSHLLVKDSADNLRFVEVDDSLPINSALISGGVKDFVYDSDKETLYFNTNAGFWKLEI